MKRPPPPTYPLLIALLLIAFALPTAEAHEWDTSSPGKLHREGGPLAGDSPEYPALYIGKPVQCRTVRDSSGNTYLVKARRFPGAITQPGDLYNSEGFHGDISQTANRFYLHAHSCTLNCKYKPSSGFVTSPGNTNLSGTGGCPPGQFGITQPAFTFEFWDERNREMVTIEAPAQHVCQPVQQARQEAVGPGGVPITMNLQWWQLELKLNGTEYDCSEHGRPALRTSPGN